MSATSSSTIGSGGSGMILGVSGGAHRPAASIVGHSPVTPRTESTTGQSVYGSVPASSSGVSSSLVAPQSSSSGGGSGRLVTISVVGWSGTEKEKGSVGVGKSCLCNRFVRPLEDDYRIDHISTLSQVDFGGRVINNDHWLYWGERTLFTDDACELTFRVLEQTEFVDDESFQPLKASSASQREPYVKRCVATRLQSADKLMYISKEQLGIEHEYEQRPLPDGKAAVDGFLCIYDVGAGAGHQYSNSSDANNSRQTEFVAQMLQNLVKTRKPIVLVTTKHDEADDRSIREAERLLSSKKEFKNSISLIESSAHKNVNVEAAFMLLASLIERQHRASAGAPRPKILNYAEAAKNRREVVDVAAAAYVQKLKSTTKDDHRLTWAQISRQLAEDPDFVHFCELCGTAAAQRLFKQHAKELREKYTQRRLQSQIGRLPDVVPLLLPEINYVRGKNWQDILQNLAGLPHFEEYFQPLGTTNDYSGDRHMDYALSSEDPRIPAELLYTQEAETCFRRHVSALEAEHRRQRMQDEFAQLIAGCGQVTPGKPLSDVRIFFLGKECFESLPEGDLQAIYERYQNQLMKRARRDFVELLLEQVDEFVNRALLRSKNKRIQPPSDAAQQNQQPSATVAVVGPPRTSAPPLPGLNERDWRELHEKLQEDARYRQLNRLHQLRDNLISQFISFVNHPLRQHCPAYPRCMDALVEQLLANHLHRPLPWNQCQDDHSPKKIKQIQSRSSEQSLFPPPMERRMNLLVMGLDGLADQVIREMRAFLQNDLFLHRGTTYNFDYRSIEGDDSWMQPQSSQFRPNGLVCAFSSRQSLDYVRNSINRTLLAHFEESSALNGGMASAPSLYSLPVVLLFAFDPSNLDDLPYLQQQGNRSADQWHCVFVGLEPSNRNIGHVTQDRRVAAQGPLTSPSLFTVEQLNRTLSCLLTAAVDRSITNSALIGDGNADDQNSSTSQEPNRRPDASLTLCLLCGDDFAPELILGPLLNHQSAAASATPRSASSSHHGYYQRNNDFEDFMGAVGGNDTATTTFYAETYSPGCGRKLRYEVDVAAYHTAFVQISEHRYSHGYILAYSVKRRASLAHLHSLAHLIPDPIPILVVAIGEVTEFFSDPAINSLITEGNEVADRMGARFITISKAAEQQFSIYTPFLDDVWKNVGAVEAAGFNKKPSENASARSSHYAPLSEFLSGCPPSAVQQHSPRENHWYGDTVTPSSANPRPPPQLHQQSNGTSTFGRPPPPPYCSAVGGEYRQNVLPSAMTRSVCRGSDPPPPSGGQLQKKRPGYSSPQQTSASRHAPMYVKDRLSESCLSVTAFNDNSSTPSPSAATVSARLFDDGTAAPPGHRKKFSDSGSDGPCFTTGVGGASDPNSADRAYFDQTPISMADGRRRKGSSLKRRNSRPPLASSSSQQRNRFGSSGDEADLVEASPDYARRRYGRYTASAMDIHELPMTARRLTNPTNRQQRRIAGWKKALLGWWDSGSDGTLNRQHSHQPPPSSAKQAASGSEKLHRSGSAASPRSAVPDFGHGNPGGSPASLKQQSKEGQPKKLGRINLQNFANVTDSISSKFVGCKTAGDKTTTASPQMSTFQQRQSDATSAAPLATPESIELGAEYMTVKDALSGCVWPSSRGGSADTGELFGDDEQQYATVDSILGAGAAANRNASMAPARPPRRSDSSGGGEKTTSTLDSTSSGDSSSAQSYEKSPYERTGRKPTPHRSKAGRHGQRSTSSGELTSGGGMTIAERVRQLNAALELNRSSSPPAPTIPPYSNERMVTVKKSDTAAVLAQRRSASEESLLDPFRHSRRSRPPIFILRKNGQRVIFDDDQDEESDTHYRNDIYRASPSTTNFDRRTPEAPINKKRSPAFTRVARRSKTTAMDPRTIGDDETGSASSGFVRKVTSSFRFRRKKSTDAGESRSTPQSPLLSSSNGGAVSGPWQETTRVFVLPPLEASLLWNSNADGADQGDGQVSSTSSWWGGAKCATPFASRSPKKDSTAAPPEKLTGKERKISKQEQKKSTSDAPAARVVGKKKSRESSQTQLVPPDATLRDLAASDDDPVPSYVQKCVEFVEATGLQVEGIYRVPGNQAHVVQLEQKFIDDPNVSFYELDLPVNAVATSLKNFFSSLSEPVVPYNIYDDLMEAMNIRQTDVRQDRLKQVLQRLPSENRAVLRYFMDHLRKVAQHFDTTAMDHRNLAKCWWPTLLRPQFDSFETMTQMTQRLEEFAQLLLEHPKLLD